MKEKDPTTTADFLLNPFTMRKASIESTTPTTSTSLQ